jgi:hypothetical protein
MRAAVDSITCQSPFGGYSICRNVGYGPFSLNGGRWPRFIRMSMHL